MYRRSFVAGLAATLVALQALPAQAVTVKPGVVLDGCAPEVFHAIAVAGRLWRAYGAQLVVTSGRDGTHCRPCPGGQAESLHYRGYAVDLRRWGVDAPRLVQELRTQLGRGYQVILEPTHLHVEYEATNV